VILRSLGARLGHRRPQWYEADYLDAIRRYAQKVQLTEGGSELVNLKLVTTDRQ
jgi:hypothetical protein